MPSALQSLGLKWDIENMLGMLIMLEIITMYFLKVAQIIRKSKYLINGGFGKQMTNKLL